MRSCCTSLASCLHDVININNMFDSVGSNVSCPEIFHICHLLFTKFHPQEHSRSSWQLLPFTLSLIDTCGTRCMLRWPLVVRLILMSNDVFRPKCRLLGRQMCVGGKLITMMWKELTLHWPESANIVNISLLELSCIQCSAAILWLGDKKYRLFRWRGRRFSVSSPPLNTTLRH